MASLPTPTGPSLSLTANASNQPAHLTRMSSSRLATLYVLVMVIWKVYAPAMCAASRARLCLPEPPTPTSSAEPRSMHSRRDRRTTCSSASALGVESAGGLGLRGGARWQPVRSSSSYIATLASSVKSSMIPAPSPEVAA